ncbi:DUF3558 domain-containing protein [Mycobacteroides abscessus]|uniref:DUF3558 domain-containing protein n=1 Tax=Mycobacteroides abscessus TaxID=36809 RepID=UPI0019D14C50|nr:DUF3558 domain-containing protein [Mycobacteroides abscessus]MBN7437930.1 DUF3558 domain-containing protein [Mycobacteroides abscessus subsp. abscessus]MBN7535262.1 DUF3558 domain-containing protein [Mycobacteroides abscessus subsp. abscessus]MDM1888360.1 DUF3558 domain-containing protein [Mycobacteroides abscessus]MDM1893218.1 DUF3558 domain-containing protein [Mycobacteroides abscessus]MDO3109741.1 DUF3558 domain-containing protein [Mycobacteroides abscessus subsp. abscessus]
MGLVRTASVWAPIVALSLTSCGTVTNGTAVSATSATSTEEAASTTSAPAIPHQPASKNNDGTTFDPCVAYGTDDLRAVGLDPASGKDIDSALLRGCKWYGAGWRVQVAVLNGSIDRYRDQKLFPGSQPIIVDGLSGVTYRDEPGNMRNCFVEIPSQQATVGTIVEVSDAPALDQIPDACTKAVEVATLTAKKLPK